MALGTEVSGTWSGDPLVAPERQRQGLGGALLRAWDRGTGVALGAGLSPGTRQLLDELRWPRAVPLPCLVKPISRRALRRPTWPVALNRLVSAITLPLVRVVSRARPLREGGARPPKRHPQCAKEGPSQASTLHFVTQDVTFRNGFMSCHNRTHMTDCAVSTCAGPQWHGTCIPNPRDSDV